MLREPCIGFVPYSPLGHGFLTGAHGQERSKAGVLFIDHVRSVAARVRDDPDPDAVVAALLHDSVEKGVVRLVRPASGRSRRPPARRCRRPHRTRRRTRAGVPPPLCIRPVGTAHQASDITDKLDVAPAPALNKRRHRRTSTARLAPTRPDRPVGRSPMAARCSAVDTGSRPIPIRAHIRRALELAEPPVSRGSACTEQRGGDRSVPRERGEPPDAPFDGATRQQSDSREAGAPGASYTRRFWGYPRPGRTVPTVRPSVLASIQAPTHAGCATPAA